MIYSSSTNEDFGPVEMWVDGEPLHLDEKSWAILKILDEDGLIDLLCERTGKSEAEVHDLLESLAPGEIELMS